MNDSVPAHGVYDGKPRRRRKASPGRSVLRWIGHVGFLLAWMLILVMGVLMWGPHLTRYKTDIIIGQSMEPTIPLYSVIVVEPVDPADIRRGDVITFEQPEVPGRKVTHRVTKVASEDGTPVFKTKGDNNDAVDPWTVDYEDTAWRERTHVPHVGWLMLKAQTRGARLLLVVVPVLIVLTMFLRWLWRGDDEEVLEGDEHLDEDDLRAWRTWQDDDFSGDGRAA